MRKLITNVEIQIWDGVSEPRGWDKCGGMLISQTTGDRLIKGDSYYKGSKINTVDFQDKIIEE